MNQDEINEVIELLCIMPFVLIPLFLVLGYFRWAWGIPGKERTLKELFEKIFKWGAT